MPQERRPLRGSRAFWPRKRAKRIYPSIKYPLGREEKEAKPLRFAGYKAGMMHVLVTDTNPNSKTHGLQVAKSASVLECPPLTVFGFRCYNGKRTLADIFSESLSKNLERKVKIKITEKNKIAGMPAAEKISSVRLLCHTNPVFKKKPEVFEVPLSGYADKQLEYAKQALGKQINARDILKAGDYLDVSAVTKGKGFAGPVKRFGIRIHGRKARQMQRHVGSLGQTEPGKIRPTTPAAGQLGFQTRTELNKRVLKIVEPKEIMIKGGFPNYGLPKNDCALIEGSIPGPRKRLVMLRQAIRPPKARHLVELKYVSLESKQ